MVFIKNAGFSGPTLKARTEPGLSDTVSLQQSLLLEKFHMRISEVLRAHTGDILFFNPLIPSDRECFGICPDAGHTAQCEAVSCFCGRLLIGQ